MEEWTEKDELYDAGASILIELEDTLTKYIGDKYQWEWRSVVGEDYRENPIWNMNLFVQVKERGDAE